MSKADTPVHKLSYFGYKLRMPPLTIMPNYPKNSRLPLLDALKGYAILGVIFVHISMFSKIPVPFSESTEKFLRSGKYGVQMFLLLSGFGLFLNNKSHESMPGLSWLVRRLFRILPLYYFMLGLFLIKNLITPTQAHTLPNILAHVLLAHSISPYWMNTIVPAGWYISLIFFCYLTTMVLAKSIYDVNSAILYFFYSVILYISVTYIATMYPLIAERNLWNTYLYLYYPTQLPIFLLGIITVFIYKSKKIRLSALSFGIILFIICFWLAAIRFNISIPMHFQFGLLFSIIFLILLRYKIKFVANETTCFIGKRSYSIYLSHMLVIEFLRDFFLKKIFSLHPILQWALFVIMTISVSIVIAIPLFYIFEKKIPSFLNQLSLTRNQGKSSEPRLSTPNRTRG